MSKSKFIALILMMLISLTGIIWVQVVWIRSVLDILNENFNRAVIASLNDAANTIESDRRMAFYNDFMFDDPFLTGRTQGDISGYLSIGSYSMDGQGDIKYRITSESVSGVIDSSGRMLVNRSIVSRTDTSFVADSGTYIMEPGGDQLELRGAQNLRAGNPGQSRITRRQEFYEWISKHSSELVNIPERMIPEVYRWEKTMELTPEEVSFALKKSFIFARIETPFEFALIKDGKVEEGTFERSEKGDFLKSNYMVRLFPDNILRQDLVLSVIFPAKTNYVLGSMTWMLGGSLLFSLIILATFALSLFFIIRQKKISEMKSDFLNNMTHEFKTPIATISLAADTITNPKVIRDENSIRHFIGLIKKENSRMNKKVETILQIASLDKREIEFRYENLSLHSVIERAVETIEIQVQQKNGRISLHLRAEEPVIYGDLEHLTNLVNNLLDNAIKYSPQCPDITVETNNTDKGIIMSVKDKGIGMTKSVQSKIFERFYRQTSGNVHDVKGFGLGLNYVRAIIEAHKGNVIVTSEPGKGSRFDVFLPFHWEN